MVSVTGDRHLADVPIVDISIEGDVTRTIISSKESTRWRMFGEFDAEKIGRAVLDAMSDGPYPCVVITTDQIR